MSELRDQILMLYQRANLDACPHIIEIVDVDPERKRTARERYKQYRDRGCTLDSKNV